MNYQALGLDGVNENITITADQNGPNLELWVNDPTSAAYSGLYYSGLAANITSLTIRGSSDNTTFQLEGPLQLGPNKNGAINIQAGDGNDTIIVGDSVNGDLAGFPGNVTITGGNGKDQLIVNDAAAQSGHDYTIGSNIIQRNGAGIINYASMESVTLNAGAGGNTIDIQNLPPPLNSTTINMGTGNDTVNVGDGTAFAFGTLQSGLTVNGQGGNETLNLNDQPSETAHTYTVTSTGVSLQGGSSIQYGNITNLAVNGGSGGNQFFVNSTDLLTNTAVNSGSGNDTVIVGGSGDSLSPIAGNLSVNGGGGTDKLILHDEASSYTSGSYTITSSSISAPIPGSIAYQAIASLELHGGGGSNTVNVLSTAPGTDTAIFSGADITTGEAYAVDVGNVMNALADIQGVLNINGSGKDSLTLNDSGSTDVFAYYVSDDRVSYYEGANQGAIINYASIASLVVNTGDGGDNIFVSGTGTSGTTTINVGAAGANTTNLVSVQANGPGGATVINTEDGSNLITVGTDTNGLDQLAAPIIVSGNSPDDELTIDDQGSANAQTYTVTDGTVSRGDGRRVTYIGLRSLTLQANNQGNAFNIQGTDNLTTTNLYTGNGADTVNVQKTGTNTTNLYLGDGGDKVTVGNVAFTLDDIAGPVNLYDSGGSDSLVVDDQTKGTAQTYTVTANSISRQGGPTIGFLFVENLTLNGGTGGNTINVLSTAQGSTTQINAGAGNDDITVASGPPNPNRLDGIKGNLNIDGQGGNNTEVVDDSGNWGPLWYRITPTSITRVGIATVTNTNVQNRTVRLAPIPPGFNVGNNTAIPGVPANTNLVVGATLAFTAAAVTSDGVAPTYYLYGAPDGASIDPTTGEFTWTPSSSQVGSWSFSVLAVDDEENIQAEAITVSVQQPQQSSVYLSYSPYDPLPNQQVTLTASVSGQASGTPTGTVTFTDGGTVLGTAMLDNSGMASITTAFAAGSHALSAVYLGDATYAGSSATQTLTVTPGATTTYLSTSTSSPLPNQPFTLTATVSATGGGTPTGSVTFLDGNTVLGSATLSNGQASFTTTLSAGSYAITAVYGGDAVFADSSMTMTQAVNPGATTTYLGSSASPSQPGQNVTFTAWVTANGGSGGSPTGTVTFLDGTTVLGTGTINNGQANFSTSSLSAGTHAITAVYGGDGSYAQSSMTLAQTVGQGSEANSSTTLTSSGSPSLPGRFVTLTATVSGQSGTPTGSVTFYDGTTALGVATLDGTGTATFTTSALTTGPHDLIAIYSGDPTYAASAGSLAQSVSQANTNTSLSSSASSSPSGQPVTFTATVSWSGPTPPTGTVTFYDGTTELGTGTLSVVNGQAQASFTTAALGLGAHSILAVYSGDGTYADSAAAISQTITS